MADNTSQTAAENIATDEIATLNGVAQAAGLKMQRVKPAFGADGLATDVSTTNPLPVSQPDLSATGTITVTDSVGTAPAGNGAFVNAASTAGSLVALSLGSGVSNWTVQVTGLTTGNLYFEGSADSSNGTNGNWIAINGRRTGIVDTTLNNNAAFNGLYRGNAGGFVYFRARSVGALSGTPAVLIRASNGTGAVFLNASVPTESDLFRGRASTFRTPGRAGTTGQKILSLHNATGSTVSVTIKRIFVDLVQTVIKAVTVLPPVVRVYLVTALPTNGTTLTKNKLGGTTTSSSSVTVLGDSSADGTGSATTLTIALTAGTMITQEYAPRLITAAGYEVADRQEFFGSSEITLGPLQGIVVMLDYVLATQNPVTDMWLAGVEWAEN